MLSPNDTRLKHKEAEQKKKQEAQKALVNGKTLRSVKKAPSHLFFRYNTAGIRGGAIWNSPGGWLQAERSTFALNQARYGGGLMSSGPFSLSGMSTLIITKPSLMLV